MILKKNKHNAFLIFTRAGNGCFGERLGSDWEREKCIGWEMALIILQGAGRGFCGFFSERGINCREWWVTLHMGG
jgi:hypothetical protein